MADVCEPHRYAEVLIFSVLTPTGVLSVTYPKHLQGAAAVVAFSENDPWELRVA